MKSLIALALISLILGLCLNGCASVRGASDQSAWTQRNTRPPTTELTNRNLLRAAVYWNQNNQF